MSVVIFSLLSADRYSMSDTDGETVATVILNPKRGFELSAAAGRGLTELDRGCAKAFVMLERRGRHGR